MGRVTQTGMNGFPEIPRETKTTIYVVLGWLLMILGILMLLGCNQQSTRDISPGGLIAQAEQTLIIGANTLADAADAGIIARDSSQYMGLRESLTEAATMIRFAWEAYVAGETRDADVWRRSALEIYTSIRPMLAELAQRSDQ